MNCINLLVIDNKNVIIEVRNDMFEVLLCFSVTLLKTQKIPEKELERSRYNQRDFLERMNSK